ncbi:hypothetical protein KIPB_003691 [Kipferlia bialata]|uniref:Uncharacterized protein n=1 Tax=Kipferlia bialata TaxID=797122 RepID=A0A9K3CSP2_9EUKA|nr:hypothetical protein KIPB_003691 [Kipferlia bialata]|eukprot:g3691.t1
MSNEKDQDLEVEKLLQLMHSLTDDLSRGAEHQLLCQIETMLRGCEEMSAGAAEAQREAEARLSQQLAEEQSLLGRAEASHTQSQAVADEAEGILQSEKTEITKREEQTQDLRLLIGAKEAELLAAVTKETETVREYEALEYVCAHTCSL